MNAELLQIMLVQKARIVFYARWLCDILSSVVLYQLLMSLTVNGCLRICRFCTFGIFSLVLCWLAAGAHLGVSLVSLPSV